MDKAPDAFRTISEVADEIDVPQHVLRFWESRFQQIRPMKRGGGRRYYRRDDVDLLRGVRHLLYGEGYTIRGVQRILREQGIAFVQDAWRAGAEPLPPLLAEDLDAADEAEVTPPTRVEPKLFAAPRVNAQERRGPVLQPAPPAEPTSTPLQPSMTPPAPTVAAEDRQKLQAALDELLACRRLIDAALQQS